MRNVLSLCLLVAFILVACSVYRPINNKKTTIAPCARKQVTDIGGKMVYQLQSDSSVIFFRAGMAIDADGSPRAYHPDNIGTDNLANAGKPGNWWALATDTGKPDGTPIVQGESDPYPGYYVSMTSLTDSRYPHSDPRRYVDAEKVPYFVISRTLLPLVPGLRKGDLGYVFNTRNGLGSYALYADTGPADKLGEASVRLAQLLEVPADPRRGGQPDGLIYIVFAGSGQQRPLPQHEVDSIGKILLDRAGGIFGMKACVEQGD
jgi:hypothetical protein